MSLRGATIQIRIGRWLPRPARRSLPVLYVPLVGAALLSLALLSPLLCIVHCALLHQPHHQSHTHQGHHHGALHDDIAVVARDHDAVQTTPATSVCHANPASSRPLAPPMPKALYELLPLADGAAMPLLFLAALVLLISPCVLALPEGPSPPPPRLA